MSFTIAHLSDAHLSPAPFPPLAELRLKRFMGWVNWKRGRQNLNDMEMLSRLVADLRAQQPDHVAMTGDIVNIALRSEFLRAVEWMRTLGDENDVSFTPGNHDAYVRDAVEPVARSFAPWTRGDGVAAGAEKFPYLRVRGEVAIVGLNSGLPTAPLLASGRLGAGQLAALRGLLEETGEQGLARVILIHHPPLSSAPHPRLRGLDDAREFEAVVDECGAEAILHGHTHNRMLHHLPSRATKLRDGRAPVIGVSSCTASAQDPRHRAAYYLIRLEQTGEHWQVSARARGPLPGSGIIGEHEPLI